MNTVSRPTLFIFSIRDINRPILPLSGLPFQIKVRLPALSFENVVRFYFKQPLRPGGSQPR